MKGTDTQLTLAKLVLVQAGKGKVDKHMPSWRPTHGSVTSATPSILVKNLR